MRIGVNATCINERPSGARQRFVGLFSQLVRLMPDSEFVFFEPEDCRVTDWFGSAANVSARRTPLNSERRLQRFLRGLTYWPHALALEDFDIFEALHMPVIRSPRGKTLLTIHDVRGIRQDAGFIDRLAFSGILRHALRRADHVVTVSEAMRSEILAFAPSAKISVIHNGIDANVFEPLDKADLASVRTALALPPNFLLAVGHLEPRKNYLRLLDAMSLLKKESFAQKLVIIGNDSGERHAVEAYASKLGLRGDVLILSGLSQAVLRAAYQLCDLFVFPSTYEGFGIPVLEAMSARRPLVLSNIPVFREITQEQGIYFDPNDPRSIANSIREVLSLPATQSEMISYGARRICDFAFDSLGLQMKLLYGALK